MDPLCVTFPDIYIVAAAKGGFVADFWDCSEEVRSGIPGSQDPSKTGCLPLCLNSREEIMSEKEGQSSPRTI